MSHHHVRRALALAVAPLVLAGCAGGSDGPAAAPPATRPTADPAGAPSPETADVPDATDGPHEVSVVADFGPLPDGSGNAVVTTSWTVDAAGTTDFVVDTPAGVADRHVMTEDEHWWWVNPEVRETVADAEWIHFDLRAVEEAGGALPDLIAQAREAVLHPGDIDVGHTFAGHEVLAADVVDQDEVHLTMAGVERPVVHRRRALPDGTTVEIPSGAVDVSDLPDVLRW